jgi:YVTN family beta-propeller protein
VARQHETEEDLNIRLFQTLPALLWLATWPGGQRLQAATEPYYAYAPSVVVQGGSFTVVGTRFNPAAAAVNISVTSGTGQHTTLAIATLTSGEFSKSVTLPASLTPGLYFVNVVDSSFLAGMNLIGPLTIVPPATPWFTFTPLGAVPGQSITVTAAGFSSNSSGAGVALITSTGQVTGLGVAALNAGAFRKSFTLPSLAPNLSYVPLVKDALGQTALNAIGPLAVGFAPLAIPVGFYPVGTAVNPQTNRIYVANSGNDSVSVLDGASNTLVSTVPVGRLPCAAGVNPMTNRVYISSVNSNDVSVIDGVTNAVMATVPVGRGPCAVVVNPPNNRIFVGNYSDNSISVVDGNTNAVVATISLHSLPAGLGINAVTGRLYAANGFQNSISVIDASTNTGLAKVPVGSVPDAIGVNEATNRIYVGNFFGRSVTVINGDSNAVIATIPVGIGPAGIAVDPGTNRIYAANYMSASVSVIDGFTNTVTATIPIGKIPNGAAVNPSTQRVYIPNSGSNSVSVIQE